MIRKYVFLLLLVIATSIPLGNLLHTGLPLTHDGQDHVARIANFYQNLQEGSIIPRWAGNLNWGYGHPVLMFLYPLPSYIASSFHFIGFSFVDSTKLVFGLAFMASGFTMYLWMKTLFQNSPSRSPKGHLEGVATQHLPGYGSKAAFVAAVLYTIAPYRFVDLYVRGAIGEHLAFVFPPLVLYFILKLSKKPSSWYIFGGALSFALLLLSHNAISLMFLPIIFLYIMYLLWQSKSKKYFIFHISFFILLGFGVSSFFWLPAFVEGKYTLRDIVTSGEYSSRFVQFENFLSGNWSYGGSEQLSKQVGIVHWVLTIFSIVSAISLYRAKNKLWLMSVGSFIIFFLALFLMTDASRNIWQTFTILQKFQFPWRLLSISVFLSAFLGGLVIHSIPKRFQLITFCLLLIALFWFNKDYWRAQDYLSKPESFYAGIYNGTTDTGESSPIWSVRFMEKRPREKIEVIEGKANIQEISRKHTEHIYIIDANESSKIRENTLYFPGWNVFVDGRKVDIEFQDQNSRGLITFFAEKGIHKLDIVFSETKLRLFSDIISIVSLVFLSTLVILRGGIWQRFR